MFVGCLSLCSLLLLVMVKDMLDNIFLPLFEVTADPSSNPNLHTFLMQVGARPIIRCYSFIRDIQLIIRVFIRNLVFLL